MAAQEHGRTVEPERHDEPGGLGRSPEHDELVAEGFGSPVADRVHALLAPVVSTIGVDLLDVQWAGGTLRLAVEQLESEEGVSTDVLAQVNRLVSPLLDQHDPIPGRYTLEVSSPGVERPLRRSDHFERAVGEVVIVKTVPGHDPRRMRGLLRSVEGAELTVDVVETDGVELAEMTTMQIAMADVASARTHFEWGPTPKKGGKGSNKGPKKNSAAGSGKKQGSKKAASGPSNRAHQDGRGQPKGDRPTKQKTNTTEEERGRT